MNILGLPNGKDLRILTQAEIKAKCQELMVKANSTMAHDSYDFTNFIENYDRSQKEPMPYCLFRYNELTGYNLVNIGCEITEDQYDDRLGQLPPVAFKKDIYKGYIVNECITGNIYEHIFNHNGKYYCVLMERC